jgi:hypothetical protein
MKANFRQRLGLFEVAALPTILCGRPGSQSNANPLLHPIFAGIYTRSGDKVITLSLWLMPPRHQNCR